MIEHRRGSLDFHRLIIEQETEIAEVAISIQNQCIEHEHPSKHILSSEFFIQFQQSRYTIRAVGKITDFRKAVRLIREQTAFRN